MPRRVKDDEKIEMIIRGLLKQPDNRRCINCNILGPQYVCTTFWTFVCTNCSGVHREFNHRVKSVSMAKFNEEEIMALQAGGNERAKQIYFKTFDPQRHGYPENSNLQRLREFVNHVYIDRRYSGENNSNKLSMVKLDSRSNSCEWPGEKLSWGRRDDFFERTSFETGSNSGRDDFHGRSLSEKSSPSTNSRVLNLKDFLEERRSPRHAQETARSGSLRNRPARFEIVDDRFREDGSVKHYERHSRKESSGGSMSPGSRRGRTISLPVVHPIKAILGEKVPELRIEGPPGANDGKDDEGPARSQKAADATTPGPTGGNEKQYNAANSCSLIDFFDAKAEPNSGPAEPQARIMASDTKDESSSIASSTAQAAANVPDMNSVESLLLEWSAPATSASAGVSQLPAGANVAQLNSPKTTDVGALAITIMQNDQPLHSNTRNPTVQEIRMHQLPSKQQSQTFLSPPGNTSINTPQRTASVESSMNQHWNASPASNDLRRGRSLPLEQQPQAGSPGEASALTARKEIPEDLFTSNFTSFGPAIAGWQMHPPHVAGYGMQFHPAAMSAAPFPTPKPKNPFDIGDDRFQVQAATFPSTASLQGALPNMPTSTVESQPSPYATALPSQARLSPCAMNMPLVPAAYMGQLSNNMPLTRPQGNANFGRTEDAFASLNPIQQASGSDYLPGAPTSPLPRVGNPFG